MSEPKKPEFIPYDDVDHEVFQTEADADDLEKLLEGEDDLPDNDSE